MPKKSAAGTKTAKKTAATSKKSTAVKKKSSAVPKKTAPVRKKAVAVGKKPTAIPKNATAEKKTSKTARVVTPPNPYGVLKSSKPTIKEALRRDRQLASRLSIQNNPDGLPWINNKVIKENLVGKRKTS